jgi:hypothetical protein
MRYNQNFTGRPALRRATRQNHLQRIVHPFRLAAPTKLSLSFVRKIPV